MLVYHYFARTLGWTPRQVDELDIEEMDWLPVLTDAFGAAQDRIQAQNSAQK